MEDKKFKIIATSTDGTVQLIEYEDGSKALRHYYYEEGLMVEADLL